MPGNRYSPTESKYKGGADEKYITYDIEQATRGDNTALYPKVKRVYVAGDVTDTDVGTFEKQSGKQAFGMRIRYQQSREGYERRGYTARRSDTGTTYEVPPTRVEGSRQDFERIEELPEDAQNIQFRDDNLPDRYANALQDVK